MNEMTEMTVVVDVRGVPEFMWASRHELAEMLKVAALDEEPRVARRLREIAAAFDSGQDEEG